MCKKRHYTIEDVSYLILVVWIESRQYANQTDTHRTWDGHTPNLGRHIPNLGRHTPNLGRTHTEPGTKNNLFIIIQLYGFSVSQWTRCSNISSDHHKWRFISQCTDLIRKETYCLRITRSYQQILLYQLNSFYSRIAYIPTTLCRPFLS